MTKVTQSEYENYILTLVSPIINTLDGVGTCSMIITTHNVNGVEVAEKVEHQILNTIIYKIQL